MCCNAGQARSFAVFNLLAAAMLLVGMSVPVAVFNSKFEPVLDCFIDLCGYTPPANGGRRLQTEAKLTWSATDLLSIKAPLLMSPADLLPIQLPVAQSQTALRGLPVAESQAVGRALSENYSSWTFQLAGGSSSCSGRVEVYYSGSWGTVCDDMFGSTDAQVVCREVGCSWSEATATSGYFPAGTGPIWLDDVACTGSESSLANCQHRGWGSHDCGHNEDVEVSCDGSGPAPSGGGSASSNLTCWQDQYRHKDDIVASANTLVQAFYVSAPVIGFVLLCVIGGLLNAAGVFGKNRDIMCCGLFFLVIGLIEAILSLIGYAVWTAILFVGGEALKDAIEVTNDDGGCIVTDGSLQGRNVCECNDKVADLLSSMASGTVVLLFAGFVACIAACAATDSTCKYRTEVENERHRARAQNNNNHGATVQQNTTVQLSTVAVSVPVGFGPGATPTAASYPAVPMATAMPTAMPTATPPGST